MKIKTDINELMLSGTATIHINADEAIAAVLQHPNTRYKLLTLLSDVGTWLREIPDNMINEMTPEQRKSIADVLAEQSARYLQSGMNADTVEKK